VRWIYFRGTIIDPIRVSFIGLVDTVSKNYGSPTYAFKTIIDGESIHFTFNDQTQADLARAQLVFLITSKHIKELQTNSDTQLVPMGQVKQDEAHEC